MARAYPLPAMDTPASDSVKRPAHHLGQNRTVFQSKDYKGE
jgi:hypothetical protein